MLESAESRSLKRRPYRAQDGSGSVSSSEMENMLTHLGMRVDGVELATLMKEADPDGDGIDFEEFVAALQKQMKNGGGGLADVFSQAADAFGFMNPLSWFKIK